MQRSAHGWFLSLAGVAALSGCGDSAPASPADASPNVDTPSKVDAPPGLDVSADVVLQDLPSDTPADAAADAVPEAALDVATDATDDVPPDVATDDVPPDVATDDVPPDVATDAPPDVPFDVTPDDGVDASPDVPLDAAPDDVFDAPPDVTTDVTTDAPVDAPPDASPDVITDVSPEPPAPTSCAALLRRAPTTPSGMYLIAPAAGVTLMAYCDMSTGRGYTFAAGRTAGANVAEILGACPAGLAAFEVRSEAHAAALLRYVRTLTSTGAWYWANHFSGPASSCPTVANRAGWLRAASDWVDASIRPAALSPLNFSENCHSDGAFDPIPLNDRDGYANRGCGAGCTVLYNSSEQPLPGAVVCSVNDLPACGPGTEDCNGLTSDGCETLVGTDDASCGACGRRCGAGLACAAGACVHLVGGSPVPPAPPAPTGAPVVMATGIAGPQGLVVARDGRVYVSALSAGTVVRIDPRVTPPTTTLFASGFSEPAQLTFDPAGALVVAERAGNRVTRVAINADGTAGARAMIASGFMGPWGVLYQPDGNLLVSNEFGSGVDRVSPAGVVTRNVISGYNGPLDLRLDTSGRLWVGQYAGTALSDGTLVHQYDAALSRVRMVSGFSGPIGIAVDDAGGAYVANWDGGAAGVGRVVRVALDGATTVFYRGLNGPHAIAFDATGGLWVADYNTSRVVRLGGR